MPNNYTHTKIGCFWSINIIYKIRDLMPWVIYGGHNLLWKKNPIWNCNIWFFCWFKKVNIFGLVICSFFSFINMCVLYCIKITKIRLKKKITISKNKNNLSFFNCQRMIPNQKIWQLYESQVPFQTTKQKWLPSRKFAQSMANFLHEVEFHLLSWQFNYVYCIYLIPI